MPLRRAKHVAAVKRYFRELARTRTSGVSTEERSSYPALANLLSRVGASLKPKVFCVAELADHGSGHPDFGFFAAAQVPGRHTVPGQMPERGVAEVKPSNEEVRTIATGDQAIRYLARYGLVLVTNTRDFLLVAQDASGRPACLEALKLAESEEDSRSKLERPRTIARLSARVWVSF